MTNKTEEDFYNSFKGNQSWKAYQNDPNRLSSRETVYLPIYLTAYFFYDCHNKAKQAADSRTNTSVKLGSSIVAKRVDLSLPTFVKGKIDLAIGGIYIVNQIGTDFYKIGKTKGKISKRLANLQIGNPNKLTPVYFSKFYFHTELERSLHLHLKDKALTNEWFSLTQQELNNLRGILRNLKTRLK